MQVQLPEQMFNFKERVKKQIKTYKNLGFDSVAKNKTRHILSMVLCAVSLILLIPAGVHLILDSLIHIISVGGSIVFYTLAEHIRN